MDSTERYFIALLRAFVNNVPPETEADTDFAGLIALAKAQSVAGIIGHEVFTFGLGTDETINDKFLREYNRTLLQYVNRGLLADKLLHQLSAEGIEHIVFKGICIRECYPVPELRSFSDVDILLHPADRDRAHRLMKKQGYDHTIADGGQVYCYSQGKEYYEFHYSLNCELIGCSEYFANPWAHAVGDGCTKQLAPEFHLCYLISHIEKHFFGGGAGVRMYLDIALIYKHFRDSIDLLLVRRKLSECGLDRFFNTVLYLTSQWFGCEFDIDISPLGQAVFDRLCAVTLSNGTFGQISKDQVFDNGIRREMSGGKKCVRFRLFLSHVFPPFSEIQRQYPKFAGKPVLLPAAWCVHWARAVSGKKLGNISKIAASDIDRAKEELEFFHSVGSDRSAK